LIIRIVDKLHNGLTISALTKERQIKYAQRIFGIYSPIAEYVGLHYFKRLLDDIAFKILYPKEAKELEVEISRNRNKEIKAENSIKEDIEKMLKVNRINDFEIQSRIKGLYSSYQKVIKYGSENGLKDRVGLRILVNNIAECYTILGLIHSKYPYIEKEFNDYISTPKANGYRSIQTTFRWSEEISVEIQIRTKEMHEFNEFGPASHIAYKLSKGGNSDLGFDWVKDLINWQKGDNNINNYRINVLEKFIYVFTPKGDTIQLKKGSTGLDFAYRIHKEIGDHCSGVKINRKMAKIDDILKTGDMVEVLTSKKIERSKSLLK
jgi:GTP pyrophosphokinase